MSSPRSSASVAGSSGSSGQEHPRIGRYEILDRIGVGGMAEVFRARATGPRGYQRNLIIKRILPHFAAHPDFVRAFVDEAKILGMLYHPNIVGIYDFGEDNGRHYLALEYLDGPTLGSILSRLRAAKKTLPLGLAAFIAREVCRGLIAVHSLRDPEGQPMNVIHRDVTPSNVMTTVGGAVKLLDFGIAKINGSENVTRVGQIKGKAGYLAPEQILGGAVDGRVDLFSLGVVLYEMLRLEPLFYGEGGDVGAVYRTLEKKIDPPSSFRADVPSDFDRVVMKALCREPAKRYQTAAEMEGELDAVFAATGLEPADIARFLSEIRDLPPRCLSTQGGGPQNRRVTLSTPLAAAEQPPPLVTAGFPELRFDNTFVSQLPADPSPSRSPRSVHGACYSRVLPVPVREPRLVAHSAEVAALLGLSEAACAGEPFLQICAGNALSSGMEPYAACYGGHQFGHWAGQLGDGRAITLGEVVNPRGERWEIQLKGAGPTPYARTADGRAVLRSSLREFLGSEALFHLGIPTTRALSLVVASDRVVRDVLYDGHPRAEPAAIVTRVAPSFLRFGNFEIFAARDDRTVLRQLADHALRTNFPELWPARSAAPAGNARASGVGPEIYAAFFHEVCRRTAVLMAHWMRVGFVHGVMNTDNMSILGLTIDYGPFGFLDSFDPDFTPNTTDAAEGRYRYANQPRVARWNLLKLAEALHPLIGSAGTLQDGLREYATAYEREEARMLAQKMGLSAFDASDSPDGDQALANQMFEILGLVETDMTLFFRGLAELPVHLGVDAPAEALLGPIACAWYAPDAIAPAAHERIVAWLRRYVARVRADGGATDPRQRKQRMNAVNPKYILRNCLAQVAIDAAENGDAGPVKELLDVLRHPYDEQPGREHFAAKRPEWARDRVGCSMLSCSS